MEKPAPTPAGLRFGVFELDIQAGELRKQGLKVKLQEQPFRVLVTLLQSPGQPVTREELHETLWPANTFVDFDRGLNRAINRLRDALGDTAENPRFIETLPQRGYRFIAPVEEIRPAVQAPEGKMSVRETPGSWRRYRLVFAALALTCAIAFLPMMRNFRPGLSEQAISSIAVLPLESLSTDPAQEHFAVGMTDELITEIAKIRSLRVTSRTSTAQYKGARKSLPQIARELGVDAIVEGTVAQSGRRIRITAQLIRASDDRHLWAEKFERDLGDVVSLQDELAQAIANQIKIKLTPLEQSALTAVRHVNSAAYEAYLTGRFFASDPNPERLKKSIEYFKTSIRLDPSYAPAYSALAISHVRLGIFGIGPAGEVYREAQAAALKALELDDSLAEAHNALADVKKGYDWDWAGAGVEYKRALELNPSYALARQWYAEYLSKIGKHDEAIAEAERARQLDPISPGTNTVLAMLLYRARRYEEAVSASQKVLELHPEHASALWFLGLGHAGMGRFDQSIAALEKAVSSSRGAPLYMGILANGYARSGNRAKALGVLKQLTEIASRSYVSPVDFAVVHAGLGDRDSAFRWLEAAYRERAMRIQELRDPLFDNLRSDSRFMELIHRIGLPS